VEFLRHNAIPVFRPRGTLTLSLNSTHHLALVAYHTSNSYDKGSALVGETKEMMSSPVRYFKQRKETYNLRQGRLILRCPPIYLIPNWVQSLPKPSKVKDGCTVISTMQDSFDRKRVYRMFSTIHAYRLACLEYGSSKRKQGLSFVSLYQSTYMSPTQQYFTHKITIR